MVTTVITGMDHGNATGVSDRATGLFNAVAADVFFCRYHGTWDFVGGGACRCIKCALMAWGNLLGVFIGGNFMGLT